MIQMYHSEVESDHQNPVGYKEHYDYQYKISYK